MQLDRRSFIKTAVFAGGAASLAAASGCQMLKFPGIAAAGSMMGFKAAPLPDLRVGIIGVGARGSGAVGRLSRIEGVRLTAVSDTLEEKVDRQVEVLKKRGAATPDRYFGNPLAWRKF